MELSVPRYLTRFRCLGGACEDTCCREWQIFVDKEHYDRLRGRLDEELFASGVRVHEGGRNPRRHALLVLREDQTCTFLAPDGLCSIHARLGEDALPNTCESFPRSLGRVGERLERIATPACPEVARLVLLADDALDRVPADAAQLGRGWVTRAADPESADPYEANFLAIRGLVLGLLRSPRFPIASRLFFGAYFADQTRASLRRGSADFDPGALQALGRSLGVVANLESLHRQLQQISVDTTYGVGAVRELLRMPGNYTVAPFARLADELEPLFPVGLRGPAAELARAYQALPPLPPALAARLDLLVARYAQHEVLRNWYVDAPSFASAYHALLLRVAVVRFVAGGLARARALAEPAALDALVVQVVYLLGRTLDGNVELEGQVYAGLERSGTRLADALALLRV